jgi:hypothetical protein
MLPDPCIGQLAAGEGWPLQTESPGCGSRGLIGEESESQWAQPPAFDGEPSVLNDDPQAQLLTAFGLLIAKPEPMSEST